MCVAADVFTQKFGYQRAEYYTGLTDVQKSLTPFDKAVYYPTNWRDNGVTPQRAKFPAFIRYGSLLPAPAMYYQKNFLGIYPIGQQPQINEPQAYTQPRNS